MSTKGVELAVDAHAELGEGPVWDNRIGRLVWVDIMRHTILEYDPATGHTESFDVGQPVAALAPRHLGGYVLAVEEGFALAEDLALAIQLIAAVERNNSGNRMNDGKCDTSGRFWAGSMARDGVPGAGAFYRLDREHRVEKILNDVTCSNGLGWSPDDSHMYYIDTGTGGVDVFDYDRASGRISGRRRLLDIPPQEGVPDGMTIDCDGCLWIALWGGGVVHRYTPDGVRDQTVRLPVSLVTSCTFGGPNLDDLYISTASELSEAKLRQQPHAGGLFVCRPGVTGTPANAYGG